MALTLRRVLWFACGLLLLTAPRSYANGSALAADLDGDGHGDRVTVTREQPSVVRVWLSASSTTHVLRSAEPVVAVALADLNGDSRPELIATNANSGLHIWTRTKKGFRGFRLRRHPVPVAVSHSTRNHKADDGPASSEATSDPLNPVPSSLVLSVRPVILTFSGWNRAPRLVRGPTASPCRSPFAPRPPPSSL
jgi:hypothetical protein